LAGDRDAEEALLFAVLLPLLGVVLEVVVVAKVWFNFLAKPGGKDLVVVLILFTKLNKAARVFGPTVPT
jgi:hypothetical protein